MNLLRSARRRKSTVGRNRGLRLEPLETRTLLSATPTDDSFRLALYADSEPIEIPADLGVDQSDNTQSLFTVDDSGEIYLDTPSGQTLGDLFEIWRDNAGVAGDNPDAILAEDQLFSNIALGEDTLQMFVNGELSSEFDDYSVQDGDEIVLVFGSNPVVSLNTNFGPIVLELFSDNAPGTVENFLNYVNDGDYENTFFHRSVTDFVIQTGGFTTSSTTYSSVNQFSNVPTDDAIENEFGLSNLEGTVAMAKLGGDPDSATSQFFVNLGDNSSNLDNQNGGFTVFAQVLDMTTSREIADLTTQELNTGTFTDVPLSDSNELAVIESIAGNGQISGVKYLDTNGDGEYDSGDTELAGIEVFLDANGNGLLDAGEDFAITDVDGAYYFQVEPGTYTVRAEVTPGYVASEPTSTDGYTATVGIGHQVSGLDFGEVDLPAPTSVDLVAASDTGDADDDNLTNRNNSDEASRLQFLVSGVTDGAEVQIFAGDTLIGSAVASGETVTVVTDGQQSLTDGTHQITAKQIFVGTSEASPELIIVIDTVPPGAITNSSPEYANVDQLYSYDVESTGEDQGDGVYSLENAPTGMTIDAATGEIEWTPTSAQAVPQSFEIILTDSAGNSRSETVNLTVLAVIPAFPDEYSATEDTVLTVDAATGVLANDGDNNSGTLTAEVVEQPEHGSLTLNADGSFEYTPNADFSGTDSFTYKANNGTDDSNAASVTITVTAVNDAPTGVADEYTVSEDATLAPAASEGVLANDIDPDEDDLTASVVAQPEHGTLTLNADGSFVYIPEDDYNGTDSFTYKVSDGTVESSGITVSITVESVPDAPATEGDSYTVNEDATLTVTAGNGVLTNDQDIDSDTFSALISSQPEHGTIEFQSDGSFVYIPAANFYGTDTFSYRATDGDTTSAATTVTLTVSAQADAPVAEDDTLTAPNDGTEITIDVLDNDTSEPDDGQSLTITAVTQGSEGGTVSIDNGSILYTAAEGFVGEETFTYTITDSDGLTDTATVTVSVVDASDNTISGVVFIDFDGDGERDEDEMGVPGVLVTLTGIDNFGNTVGRTALTDANGDYTFAELNAGTYQVTERQPTALADGEDSSAVSGATVDDDAISNLVIEGGDVFGDNNFGEAGLLPQYISISFFFASAPSTSEMMIETVAQAEALAGHADLAEAIRNGDTEFDNPDNQAPVAEDDAYSVDEDTTLTVTASNGLLANDTDADGDTLTALVVNQPEHGTLSLNSDGSFTYVPDDGFQGTDSFTYLASDGFAASSAATVTITVDSENDAPVAEDDSYQVNQDATLTVDADNGVLANDTDADGDTLTVTLGTDVSNGTLDLNEDGSFTYTPDADFHGTDSFTYTVNDGTTDSAEATVTIDVNSLASVADDTYSVAVDGVLTVSEAEGVLANDTDADGDTLTVTLVTDAEHGLLTLEADGSFLYVPDEGYHGTDTFTYVANDGFGDSVEATVTIHVNTAPEADDDAYSTDEDVALTIDAAAGVLDNDSDANDDDLVASLVSGPSHGTLTLEEDGSFTYTPDANYHGTDTFTYVANDGLEDSAQATVTITINSVEDVPVAAEDEYSVPVNGELTVTASEGVLANDSDGDGDTLTASLVTDVTHGTLTFNGDGSFSYTPTGDYHGTDTFTYTASDGTNQSSETTVTISVNTVATVGDDEYTVAQNTTLTVNADAGLLANDSDVDDDALLIVLVSEPANGSLTFDQDGSFIYVPDTDFHGTDTFTYLVDDGFGDSEVATVTIHVNSPPTVSEDAYVVAPNGTLTVIPALGVLANDSDADDDSLTAEVATEPGHGTVTMSADGSFTYVPETDYHGTDTFTYVANDGINDSVEVTVTIQVNTTPSLTADDYTIDEDFTLNIDASEGVLANDSDADGDTLTVTVDTPPSNGTLDLSSDGSFSYTPNANFNGTDTFTYVADDGFGYLEEAVVTITVTPMNDAPVAVDDLYTVLPNGSLSVVEAEGVLANDTDVEDQSLSAEVVTDVSHGTLTLDSDGSFAYEPEADFHGIDSFTYKANDGTDDSAVATVTIHVNTPASALADSYSVDEDTTLTIDAAAGVLLNDSDADGDTLTAAVIAEPTHGTLTLNADGSFTYTPDADYSGEDTFTYAANDGFSEPGEAIVAITVNPINDAPVTADDLYTVVVGGELDVLAVDGVLANDDDADGDTLTVTLGTDVADGVLELDDSGSFVYKPTANFHGTVTFTYVASDGTVDSAETTVTIHVNTPATTVDDSFTVVEDTVLTIDAANGVLANDTDTDSDDLTAVLAEGPSNGTVTLNADGSFTYTPDADFAGADSFTYLANDGYGDSSEATVTITVSASADVPTAADDTYSVAVNGQLTVDAASGVAANDSDPDGDPLEVSLASDVASGDLTLNKDGSFSYTPEDDFHGTVTFTYTVNDGTSDSEVATVTIHVNSVANVGDDSYQVDEDNALVVDGADYLLDNDSDPDEDTLAVSVVQEPAHGTLDLNTDGTFTYTPDADFFGTDTFTYVANDGFGDSAEATVTITVNGVNDIPSVADDAYIVPVDGDLTVNAEAGVLSNDSDVDGDTLTVTLMADATHGDLTLNDDGSFDYSPDEGFHGTDTFTYKVNDGTDDSTEATVTIQVNTVATVVNDVYSVNEEATLTVETEGSLLANDTDPDGDSLTVVLVQDVAHGTLDLNDDGTFTYTPEPDFSGDDTFTYMANDGYGDSLVATATITVIAINDAPVVADDAYSVPVNVLLSIDAATGVLANDTDADGDPLTVSVDTNVEHGTLTWNDDGSFTYTPDDDFHGTDTFTYKVSDGTVDSAVATVTIDVNSLATAEDDDYSVDEDGTLTIVTASGVLANDSDPDNDTLAASVVQDVAHGSLTLEEDGSFTYTPDADFNGTDSFTYAVDDGYGNSNVATVEIEVNPIDDVTIVADDAYDATMDVILSIDAATGVLANDTEVDGDTLTLSLVADVEHGTLTLNQDGSFSYTPDAGYEGTDTFIYTVNDGTSDSAQATVTLTIAELIDEALASEDEWTL